jgi:hypothetical protein
VRVNSKSTTLGAQTSRPHLVVVVVDGERRGGKLHPGLLVLVVAAPVDMESRVGRRFFIL